MKKVLCLGDSLTKGYVNNLKSNLENYIIHDGGEDGDLVTEMYNRLNNLLDKNSYDIIILLGGTNDLGSLIMSEDDVFDTLLDSFKQIYELIDNNHHVTQFIHLTIPFNAFDKFDSEKNSKKKVNNLIKNDLDSKKRVILDLNDTDFNYLSLNENHRDLYWSDSIHYSNIGYELLAKYISNKLALLNN